MRNNNNLVSIHNVINKPLKWFSKQRVLSNPKLKSWANKIWSHLTVLTVLKEKILKLYGQSLINHIVI